MSESKVIYSLLSFAVATLIFAAQPGFAQTETTKSSEEKKISKSVQPSGTASEDDIIEDEGSDIILDEILIEAVIEKPNVAILPSKELGTLEEIEFINRSFERELKTVPRGLFWVDRRAEQKKSVERLKNILSKKKK